MKFSEKKALELKRLKNALIVFQETNDEVLVTLKSVNEQLEVIKRVLVNIGGKL